VILVGSLATPIGAIAQVVAGDAPIAIREWLDTWGSGVYRSAKDREPGLRLKFTLTTSTSWSRERVESSWAAIQNKPDHPDRSMLRQHRALLSSPEIQQIEIYYAGGSSWFFESRREQGWSLQAGGDGSERWAINSTKKGTEDANNELILTREGVPFPSPRNIGMFFDDTQEWVRLWVMQGIPSRSSRIDINRVADGWLADFLDDSSASKGVVKFQIHQSGKVIVTQVGRRTFTSAQSGSAPGSIDWYRINSGHVEAWRGVMIPSRTTWVRNDGVVETAVIESSGTVPIRSVQQQAQIPDIQRSTRVLDFRTGSTESWIGEENYTRVVWRREGDEDIYEHQDAINPIEQVPITTQQSATSGSSATRIWGFMIVISVCGLAITVIVKRKMWS
jgi:hypothetical protein